jgi:hypothetical protein
MACHSVMYAAHYKKGNNQFLFQAEFFVVVICHSVEYQDSTPKQASLVLIPPPYHT